MAEKKTKEVNKKIPKRKSRRKLTPVEIFVGNNGMLIKIAFIVILAAFLFVIFSAANAKDIDLKTVSDSLKKDTDITTVMKKMDDRDLMRFMGLNSNDYSQVVYYRNTTALAVDELLIVKTDDAEDINAVAEAVDTRIDSQLKVYESYGPEQCALLKNAVQTKKGDYYFYCTAKNADIYEEVLLDAIQ
ncbi:MAG: DUF4358 domain-containing protein [Clostridiales bacterium]|nr:DUF4358 domain-containing protein [Candidatus Crickella equi]